MLMYGKKYHLHIVLKDLFVQLFLLLSPKLIHCLYLSLLSTFHYIPVTEVLKKLLENREAGQLLLTQTNSDYGLDILLDVCEGTAIRSNNFFSSDAGILPLHFYINEFEVCNPIGARRGKYKMTAVYFTVGSLTIA